MTNLDWWHAGHPQGSRLSLRAMGVRPHMQTPQLGSQLPKFRKSHHTARSAHIWLVGWVARVAHIWLADAVLCGTSASSSPFFLESGPSLGHGRLSGKLFDDCKWWFEVSLFVPGDQYVSLLGELEEIADAEKLSDGIANKCEVELSIQHFSDHSIRKHLFCRFCFVLPNAHWAFRLFIGMPSRVAFCTCCSIRLQHEFCVESMVGEMLSGKKKSSFCFRLFVFVSGCVILFQVVCFCFRSCVFCFRVCVCVFCQVVFFLSGCVFCFVRVCFFFKVSCFFQCCDDFGFCDFQFVFVGVCGVSIFISLVLKFALCLRSCSSRWNAAPWILLGSCDDLVGLRCRPQEDYQRASQVEQVGARRSHIQVSLVPSFPVLPR